MAIILIRGVECPDEYFYSGGCNMCLLYWSFSLMLFCSSIASAADGSKSSFLGNITSFVISVIVFGLLIDFFIKKNDVCGRHRV
jgi:hypothetical protein